MSDTTKKHGGNRAGAGRPKGTGRFGGPTKAIRVPEQALPAIQSFLERYKAGANEAINSLQHNDISAAEGRVEVPLFSSKVAAGFPSPADDYLEKTLDLNEHLIQKPAATFLLRVEGESMTGVGIMPGDILIVDKAIKPTHNKIVIAAVDGELTVKRLYKRDNVIQLLPENPSYPPIEIREFSDLVIWGVVTGSIRRFDTY